MKTTRLSNKTWKTCQGRSGGFTILEVVMALALFAIIGTAFAGGLGTASRAVLTGDIRTNAESVARTEMEYVKSQGYYSGDWSYVVTSSGSTCNGTCPTWFDSAHHLSVEHTGYSANVQAEPLDDPDDGIQKITVTVSHDDNEVLSLEGYKVNR